MIGSVAGVLTTLALVPQVFKVLKSKDTSSISLGMYYMQISGILLWLIHGAIVGDMALLVANIVTFGLAFIILVCKIRYK